MEELFNLNYKSEIEALKEEENYEQLGDEKYINHKDMEARLYWAFCRPSGSCDDQLKDPHPLVSIMAFNHSRLKALKRFSLVHPDVIKQDDLRIKITKRSRMLFRDLIDNDFVELNMVLKIVPVFLDLAIDQLKHGRKWNDISANELEASKFLDRVKKEKPEELTDEFYESFYEKLQDFEEFDSKELKTFIENIIQLKDQINSAILKYYQEKVLEYLQECDLHILQKKSLEKLANKL